MAALERISEPATRLRVLANLYVSTWDIPDKFDAGARHLEEIVSIGRAMPHSRFQRLYEEHVLAHVRRMPLFGEFRPPPDADTPPDSAS